MDWLHRIRRALPRASGAEASEDATPDPVERAAPGVAALFDGLAEDGTHAVLDLGPAVDSHLRIFSGFGRQIRFAGLLPEPPRGEALTAALRALPLPDRQPYDVVLAWNLLDRLSPAEHTSLIARMAEVTAPGARLYAIVDASDESTVRPLRYALRGLDRVSQQAVGPLEAAPSPLLPSHVERILAPFEVMHAFTLKSRHREYVAVKRGGRVVAR